MKKVLFTLAFLVVTTAGIFAQAPNGGSKYQSGITHRDDPPEMKLMKQKMLRKASRLTLHKIAKCCKKNIVTAIRHKHSSSRRKPLADPA